MANKVMVWVLAGAGLALASGGAWWLQQPSQGTTTEKPAGQGSGMGAGAGAARPAGPGGPGGGGAPGVEVAKVKTMPLQDDAQAVGSLKSRQSVILRPEVAGRVAELAFADGARVRKGQLLLRLDDTLQKAELSQAEAQLSIARANLKRNQELVAENFVAQRVLDESRASLQVAEAQVALAQARLGRMRIVAPIDGTVGIRTVNLGDYVKDGADLVNLEDTSTLYVDFRMPERYQGQLAVGQGVKVQIDALPGRDFSAKVQALDPLVDANGRSVLVRAAMAPATGVVLRPGMFARVTTVFSVNDGALVVPEEAIVPQGGRQVVFKLASEGEGEAAKTVVRRTEVELGARRGSQVQIVRGLSDGDTVVVAGQQRLQRDGMAVRVVDMSKAGAGGPPGGPPGGGKPGAGKPGAAAPGKSDGAPR